jgi:speckle-type POZ protein
MYLANRSSTAVSASYKLFIRNQLANEDELVFSSVGVKQFEVQGQGKIDGWGRDRFLPHDRITLDSGILLNDTVIFAIEIAVYGDMENYCTSMNSGSTLDQDLRTLLKHGSTTADVTVVIGEKEYSLHRCILSARSPVFRAMLENKTREKESGVIFLQEDDPAVLEHFINFLYSDYLR